MTARRNVESLAAVGHYRCRLVVRQSGACYLGGWLGTDGGRVVTWEPVTSRYPKTAAGLAECKRALRRHADQNGHDVPSRVEVVP